MAGESPGQASWMVTGLAAGSVVAGYRVEARIATGGMAMVFRARDESLGRTVALKVLAPTVVDDAAFRERFIRESRAAAVVDHPHIIPVYGAGEFEGMLYIAMRYVAGGDLRALLQREGPLPAGRAAFLLSPLASALDAGHAAELVHRDVKPANILIDSGPGRPNHLYLSDFGLAKGNASTGLTGTGQFLGTLEYCAPEQISGKATRPQTDQYALGCVAYTMFTGTVPFPRDEVTALLWAHMSEPPPPVTELRPDLPAAVDQVLARAMAKDPEERYPTCAAFAEAVRAALGLDAYTTPSNAYTAAGTGLSPARDGGGAGAAAVRADIVPDFPGPALTQHDGPPTPATSPSAAVDQARRRRRRGMLAAAAVVVAAGGATATVLGITSHNTLAQGAQSYPQSLATLPEPGGATPAGVAFESDRTLITIDAAAAYSWDIASDSPVQIDYEPAAVSVASAVPVAGAEGIQAGGQVNVVVVTNTATGAVVATLTVPSGTTVDAFALSTDGTEAAVADSNGSTYVWKLGR